MRTLHLFISLSCAGCSGCVGDASSGGGEPAQPSEPAVKGPAGRTRTFMPFMRLLIDGGAGDAEAAGD